MGSRCYITRNRKKNRNSTLPPAFRPDQTTAVSGLLDDLENEIESNGCGLGGTILEPDV